MAPVDILPSLLERAIAIAGFSGSVVARTVQICRGDFGPSGMVTLVAIGMLVNSVGQVANAVIVREAWVCVAWLSGYAFFSFGYFVLLLRELVRRDAA